MTKLNRKNPRGSALITTIWVIIFITGTALVMSKSMRVETLASANRLSQSQADVTERGAEQFLCSVVSAEVATPGSTALVGMEARQIGDGYFWVLKANPDNEQTRSYGLTDEAGKLDINTATTAMLDLLPNMTSDVGSSIYNWKGTATSTDGLGATDQDYESLPDPYLAKHAAFETTEELMLIKGIDTTIMFGSDTNRDGFLDSNEQSAGGAATGLNTTASSDLGLFPFVTAYGAKATAASTSTTGTRLVNVNLSPMGGGGGPGRGGGGVTLNSTALRNALTKAGVSSVNSVITNTTRYETGGRSFTSVLGWAATVNMTSADLTKVFTQLTATPVNGGGGAAKTLKINVNTAPKAVLMCIPGLEESDADAIVAQRQLTTSSNPADISWLLDAVQHNKLTSAAAYFTGTSKVFSGDILAVSPDGRAYRRYRVVIDGSKSPPYVIYRRDLTRHGWPLGQDIRDALRNGEPPPDANATATNSNSPFGQGN